MNNPELLQKMKEDMDMRGFSHWTKESYELKAKDVMRYFNKPMEEVTLEELSTFFNACEDYKYKTIFMMIYGSGLRISEAADIRVEDIDSKKMRIFVGEGKGKR